MVKNTAVHHVPVETVCQLDGAPPHFSRHIRAFLHMDFPARWVRRRGNIPWAPRSPNFSLDFLSWGFEKDNIYREKKCE
jgi:hypothetical protein